MHTIIQPFFLLVQWQHVLRNLYTREKTLVKWMFIEGLYVYSLECYVSNKKYFSTCTTNTE